MGYSRRLGLSCGFHIRQADVLLNGASPSSSWISGENHVQGTAEFQRPGVAIIEFFMLIANLAKRFLE